MTDNFPHFSRLFSAPFPGWLAKAHIWIGIGILYSVSLWMVQTGRISYLPQRLAILADPYSPEPYVRFAFLLKNDGDANKAKKQLFIAQDTLQRPPLPFPLNLTPISSSVLGMYATPNDIIVSWRKEEEARLYAYQYWKRVAFEKPDYRDAYITLAVLLYQLGKIDEAKIALDRVFVLDPNNHFAVSLKILFGL